MKTRNYIKIKKLKDEVIKISRQFFGNGVTYQSLQENRSSRVKQMQFGLCNVCSHGCWT